MSEHRAHIAWRRTADFTYETYNRAHDWSFDGGARIAASSSPEFHGDADRIDPEKALVAAMASCHMLTFLAIAARKRLTVDAYSDDPVGHLEKNATGKLAIARATLRPRVTWGAGVTVSKEELDRLHRLAHEQCFIANSVKTAISVAPQG